MRRLLLILLLLASSPARADDIGAMPEQTPCSRPLGCWQNGDIVGDAGGGVLNLGQRFIVNCAPGMPCVVQIGQGTATSTDRVSLRLNSGAGNNNTGPSVIYSRNTIDLAQTAHDNANFYMDAGIGYYGTQGNWLFRPAINDNVCKSGTRQDRTCSTDDVNAITGCPGAGTCTGTGPPGGCCAANPVTMFIGSYGQVSLAYGGTSTITTAVPSALFPIIDIGTNNQFNFDNNNDAIAGLKFGNTTLSWIASVDDSGTAQGTVTVYDTTKIVSAPTDTARTMGLVYGFLFAPVRSLTSASANVALTVNRTRGFYFAPSYGRSAAVGTIAATEVTGFFDQPVGIAALTITNRRGYWYKDRGSGGTVTTSYGLDVDDQTVGTTAAGYHTGMNSGTGKWTVLADGTAHGSHKGNFRFGDNTDPSTDVLEVLGNVHLFSGNSLKLNGATSGTSTISPPAAAGGTVTLNASGTMTVPDATDTFVGKSTTDLFQNKTLRDDTVTFVDDGDTSKKVAFQISGITTATTRTWTIQDSNDFVVGRDTTDTLTHKTLDAEGTSNLITIPVKIYLQGGECNNATAGTGWDVYATDPVAGCVNGTVIKKGVLTFDDTNTCTSNTATTGCAFTTFTLPSDFTGNVDARVFFTVADTTNGHTVKWTLSTKCTTPLLSGGGAGTADDPATLNAAQTLTYTVNTSDVSASARYIEQTSITMTGCSANDIFHLRIGRDVSDTSTASVNLVGVMLTLRRGM